MRVFIALPVPDEVKKIISQIKTELKTTAKIKWVEAENCHITLKFLGEVNPNQVKNISAVLKNIFAQGSAYELSMHGVGFFPNRTRPRVMWAGVKDQTGNLDIHIKLVNEALYPLGFQKESNSIHHLTMGRIRSPITESDFFSRVDEVNKTMHELIFPVQQYFLLESQLSSYGPKYYVLEKYELT